MSKTFVTPYPHKRLMKQFVRNKTNLVPKSSSIVTFKGKRVPKLDHHRDLATKNSTCRY